MKCTPGYLKGAFLATIIQHMHNSGIGGTWHVHTIESLDLRTARITFKVGTVHMDGTDDRQEVTVVVGEV